MAENARNDSGRGPVHEVGRGVEGVEVEVEAVQEADDDDPDPELDLDLEISDEVTVNEAEVIPETDQGVPENAGTREAVPAHDPDLVDRDPVKRDEDKHTHTRVFKSVILKYIYPH